MQLRVNTDSQAAHVQGEPLPVYLYAALEVLSGYTMDDVRVHYNSDKPEQVQARAYAYGTDIYLAPGQEKYLPHEAWHVVQQKQGKVRPTEWLNDEIGLNTDRALEMEADFMVNVIEAQILELLYSQQFDIYNIKNRKAVSTCIKCPVIQRVGLESLVMPQINQLIGDEIELQDSIMRRLNEKNREGKALLHLCSLELIDGALIPLIAHPPQPLYNNNGALTFELGYDLLKDDTDLQNDIIKLIFITLKKSGQFYYLKNNGLLKPYSGWIIYVDVHYYYKRGANQYGFHRDSVGRTMFVNLNYNNKEEIAAPSLIIDPTEYLGHQQSMQENLPPIFFEDVKKMQDQLRRRNFPIADPRVRVPENGVVSWIDELVDHATPYLGHRGLSSLEIIEYLKSDDENNRNFKRWKEEEIRYNGQPIDAQELINKGWDFHEVKVLMGDGPNITGKGIIELITRIKTAKKFYQNISNIIEFFLKAHNLYFQKRDLVTLGFDKDFISAMFLYYEKPNLDEIDIINLNNNKIDRQRPALPIIPKLGMSQELYTRNIHSITLSSTNRQFLRTWVQAVRRHYL